jgi:hypothetical protein
MTTKNNWSASAEAQKEQRSRKMEYPVSLSSFAAKYPSCLKPKTAHIGLIWFDSVNAQCGSAPWSVAECTSRKRTTRDAERCWHSSRSYNAHCLECTARKRTSETRMHGARAHAHARSAYCIACTTRQSSLDRRGAPTAWRPEPQPGASTGDSIAAGAAIRSLKFTRSAAPQSGLLRLSIPKAPHQSIRPPDNRAPKSVELV